MKIYVIEKSLKIGNPQSEIRNQFESTYEELKLSSNIHQKTY